jgi:hypothetical protein
VSERYQGRSEVKLGTANLFSYDSRICNCLANLMFVDLCIIVKNIKKKSTRRNSVSELYYSIFIRSSTCFGRQRYCAWQRPPTTRPTTFHVRVWKTRGCQCSFRLLMMGGVSPETCWATYKYGIIEFWHIVASCWIFLYELSGYLFVPISCVGLTAHLIEYCAGSFKLFSTTICKKEGDIIVFYDH